MDIAIALTSIAKSLEVLKAMRDIDKNYDAAAYKATIADLMNSLADAKIALVDARDEISTLKKDKEKLLKQFAFKGEHTVKMGQYTYEVMESGRTAYLPFCPKCLSEGQFFPMVQNHATHTSNCPNCNVQLATRSISHAQVTATKGEDGLYRLTAAAEV